MTPPNLMRSLRAALTVATESLRVYRAGALAVVALGVLGLAMQVPIGSFGGLRLPPIPAAATGITWTARSLPPGAVQAEALQQLVQLLLILGWGALVIAGVSMLTGFAAQAAERAPEIGVRRAAGASRSDRVLAFLGEGAILLLGVLLIGLPVAALILSRSAATWPGLMPGAGLLPWPAALFAAAVIGFGVLAPLRYSSARYMRSPADGQVTLGVPAFQLAVSVAILMGSAALLRLSPGNTPASANAPAGPALVLALDTTTASAEERARSLAALLQGIGSDSAVASVSMGSPGALLGLGQLDDLTTDCGRCVRGQIEMRWDLHTAAHHLVSPNALADEGVRLIDGRDFGPDDRWGTKPVAIVSRHLALSGFQSGGPVGRDLYLGDDWPKHPYRVIGVVDDPRPTALGGALEPLDTIYLSALQHPPRSVELVVRGRNAAVSDSALAATVLRRAAPEWKGRVVGDSRSVAAAAIRPIRWFGKWFTLVGGVVLLAALAGTFGTMRRWVESMSAELAARRAVGATRLRIVTWVLWRTAGTGIKGVVAGMFLYLTLLRGSLTNLVGQVAVWDPALFGALAALLLGAAVLGALLPTVRLLRRPIAGLLA